MLETLELEEAATKAAGNWERFDSFVWFRDRELEDADQWSVKYTHNRESRLLDQSNAQVIKKSMEPFAEAHDPDVVFESHSHWAVGHVDGFSVRVFDQHGEITAAFKAYHELTQRMDVYPILDETDYSNREYEATLINFKDAAWRLKNDSICRKAGKAKSIRGSPIIEVVRSRIVTIRAAILLRKHFGKHSRAWASRGLSSENESP